MRRLAAIAGLAIAWLAMTGSLSVFNLVLGVALAAAAVLLVRRGGGAPRRPRLGPLFRLAGLFVFELFAGAFAVAALALRPDLRRLLRPAIVAFPLTATTDGEITILANLITLTPGTLTLDVSADRRFLYVHVLDLNDRETLRRGIADGFERTVLEVFK